jgi:hypothetical protein
MRKADVDTTPQIETDVDDLYKLPLAEFTAARNSLAGRLKKAGLIEEANRVKSLGKPSISAWTVNQLFWKQRDSFEHLMTAGERVGQAHALQLAGKTADTRGALAARRDALTNLARLAESLLRDSGHSPTAETIRRITTTIEALSSRSSMEQNHRPGRLSEDVDPPGFESLAAFMPVAERIEVAKAEPPKKEVIPPAVAAARAALATAEETLRLARGRTQELARTLEEASQYADDAEAQLAKAQAAAEAAVKRRDMIAATAEKAVASLKAAEAAVDKARKKLETSK